ncbi:uncharacterized protein LOC143020290 isoform X1 [Oratosquilla oratoria]|uniref:uncharacterized protein LOC143020290 isoform X1 n=2 Tax=Oratosquilla oratoria TaxID=337810 RepID=UPI003F75B4D7
MDSNRDPPLSDPTSTPPNDIQRLENDATTNDMPGDKECITKRQEEKEKDVTDEKWQTPNEKGEESEWEQCRLLNGDTDLKEEEKDDHKDNEETEDEVQRILSWWQKFWLSLKPNPKLLRIKFIAFFSVGGMIAFLPFLTLHMKQLGLTVREIAVIYAILPMASIIGPPISGLLADAFGRYILVFVLNLILNMSLHTSLLFVPKVPKNGLNLECHTDGYSLEWQACNECWSADNGTSNLVLKGCHFTCPDPPSSNLTFCLSDRISQKCIQDSFSQNVELAVNLSTSFVNNTCSSSMSNIIFNGLNYIDLSCPAVGCPIECHIEGAPECGWGGGGVEQSEFSVTFWVYLFLRLGAILVTASTFTMVDAITLALIKEHGSDFGKQRVLPLAAQALTPFFSGMIVDWWSQYQGSTDYMPVFVLGDIFLMMCLILLKGVNPKVETSASSVLGDLKKLVKKMEIDVFLFFLLILGSNWGFIESFLFVYLIELNAPNFMLGLTMTVGCMVSLPMMVYADNLVRFLGRQNIFIISFFTYAVRMFGYASISDPWFSLPFEALEVICFQLMWVAAVTYCPILAPKGLLATMIGLAGSVHYSIGRGVGSFMGGNLISVLGMKGTFKIFGIISIIGGILNITVYKLFLEKKLAKKEKKLQEEKINDMEGSKLIEMQEPKREKV